MFAVKSLFKVIVKIYLGKAKMQRKPYPALHYIVTSGEKSLWNNVFVKMLIK